MSYEYFYPGTPYTLEPGYGDLFSGYRAPFSGLGLTTDPRSANQVQEVSTKLNPGGKIIEISAISPEIFDAIPKQHLKEINRISKLIGTDTTVHGPLVEPSGYTREGWSEAARQLAENQMSQAVERSHELSPDGNIPVTFHSSAMLPQAEEILKTGGKEAVKSVLIADTRTGDIRQIKETKKFFPEKIPEEFHDEYKKIYKLTENEIKDIEEGKRFFPQWEIQKTNKETWNRVLNELNFYALRGVELVDVALQSQLMHGEKEGLSVQEIEKRSSDLLKAYKSGTLEKLPEEEKRLISPVFRNLTHANIFLRDSYNSLRELYNRVYKDASEEDKKHLDDYKKEVGQALKKDVERDPERMREFAKVIEDGVRVLGGIKNPQMFKPLNEFLIEKDSETLANVALNAYKKFEDKAPIVSIENPPAGAALSRGGEIKKLIEESRKKFIEKAKKEGVSDGEARDMANKLIGATWDVGHINMLRKYGYDKVDLLKETERIAPFVKHVHLSDNFGMEHTELPMGMGNVPLKEIMEKLGKEGFEAKKIIEAGSWWQHFKTPPTVPSLEAMGSPLYGMIAQPYWNQIAATYGNYLAFPLAYMPEQHFSLYGSGFSSLPQELGGQIPGKQSRVTGTPMA